MKKPVTLPRMPTDEPYIGIDGDGHVCVTLEDKILRSESVESHVLYAILRRLEHIDWRQNLET